MSLRDSILACDDRPKQKAEIPEWGSPDVYLRRMSGDEREQWDSWVRDNRNDPKGWRARLVAMTLVDVDGSLVFGIEDAALLNAKSHLVLSRLWDQSADLNGLSEKAAQEAEKNS